MVFGPIPIVFGSMALSTWLRPERSEDVGSEDVTQNEALASHAAPGVASAGELEARPKPRHPLTSHCRATAERWQKLLGDDCAVIARPPFVLAGDLAADVLQQWHDDTVAPAAAAMANCYFRVPPSAPITVLLFSKEASYNNYAQKLFNERNISVYGYYKPEQRTLVMNIATGGGTLVHELTHALVDFDFPKIPAWFNEGLASLHEQCRFRSSDEGPWIEGLENWRLPGLQSAIRKQRLRSLQTLVTADDFRGAQEGVNYAQARYLCLYLQRHDLLEKFYRNFRADQQQDPSGLVTLKALFPDKSWDDLDRDFQAWVLTLER